MQLIDRVGQGVVHFAVPAAAAEHPVYAFYSIAPLEPAGAVAIGADRYPWVVLPVGRQPHDVVPGEAGKLRQMAVVEGVSQGTRVVVEGSNNLRPGVHVAVAKAAGQAERVQ